MSTTKALPKVHDLISRFKNRCARMGWTVYEYEDLIKVGDEYHLFLWADSVYPNTFARISRASKIAHREGISYRVLDVSYTAWIFPRLAFPRGIREIVVDNDGIIKKTALYGLGQAYSGTHTCLRLNETDSVVFKEFEEFLGEEYEIRFAPISEIALVPVGRKVRYELDHDLPRRTMKEKPEILKARELMMKLNPVKFHLKMGEFRELDRGFVAVKTADGRIVLYEVAE